MNKYGKVVGTLSCRDESDQIMYSMCLCSTSATDFFIEAMEHEGIEYDDRAIGMPPWRSEERKKAKRLYAQERASGGYQLDQKPLRNYQREICDDATESDNNWIVYLPTGTGKTFVAIEIVRRIMSKAAQPSKPKPLAIFLVERMTLVFQQSKAFDQQYKRVLPNMRPCGRYVGDTCDFNIQNWNAEFATHEVMCFTAGLFRNLLANDDIDISLKDVTVLVFDEAHHVCKTKGESCHDFNMIMKDFYFTLPRKDRPRVVAMTASPGGAVTVPETRRAVQELCYNLVRSIIT